MIFGQQDLKQCSNINAPTPSENAAAEASKPLRELPSTYDDSLSKDRHPWMNDEVRTHFQSTAYLESQMNLEKREGYNTLPDSPFGSTGKTPDPELDRKWYFENKGKWTREKVSKKFVLRENRQKGIEYIPLGASVSPTDYKYEARGYLHISGEPTYSGIQKKLVEMYPHLKDKVDFVKNPELAKSKEYAALASELFIELKRDEYRNRNGKKDPATAMDVERMMGSSRLQRPNPVEYTRQQAALIKTQLEADAAREAAKKKAAAAPAATTTPATKK